MKKQKRGAFITVEGADGAGKTTQLAFIRHWLEKRSIHPDVTREPGGTSFGEGLRALLLEKDNLEISNEAELLTVFAARQQHLDERIVPSLNNGIWVLSDRFTDASYAYQGGGRGIDCERIHQLEQWVQRGLQPDLTILLDIEVEAGVKRSDQRNEKADRFERQSLDFKSAVRQAYLARAAQAPDRIKVIDAASSVEQVQQAISAVLETFVSQWELG